MDSRPLYLYPEIEARAVNRSRRAEQIYSGFRHHPPTTDVDLLELGIVKGTALWKTGLDHDSLIGHFKDVRYNDPIRGPLLRIFFLKTIKSGEPGTELFNQFQIQVASRLGPLTAQWLQDKFNVSPIFLDCITTATHVVKTGSISFLKRNEKGEVVAIDGFYRYSSGFNQGQAHQGRAHVWFCHDLTAGSSTYILDNCPPSTKEFIQSWAFGNNANRLGRPCTVDAIIAEDCGHLFGEEIIVFRKKLIKYEKQRIASQDLSAAEMSVAVEDLHHISQKLHIISEDITDLEERLEFLCDVHRQYTTHSSSLHQAESVLEAFQFLISRNKIWKRWTLDYKARTEIRINLFFNLATQKDNRTNLEIASFMSRIAVDTQRDSSSMITIAAVTMFFLPGTFVSALFSMVFFNSGTDLDGRETITVSPKWWYFVAITIPLTVLVFVVWVLWQRWRNSVKGISKSDDAEEKRYKFC